MNDVRRSLALSPVNAQELKRDSRKDPRKLSGRGGRGYRLNYAMMKTRDTTNVRFSTSDDPRNSSRMVDPVLVVNFNFY